MTTLTMDRGYGGNGSSGKFFFVLISVIILAILAVTIGAGLTMTNHAARHSNANDVYNCDRNNMGLTLVNIATGRKTILCEFRPGQWGRLVVENDGKTVVTSFANKERPLMNTLKKAIENLYRQGYTKVEFCKADLIEQVANILANMQ